MGMVCVFHSLSGVHQELNTLHAIVWEIYAMHEFYFV